MKFVIDRKAWSTGYECTVLLDEFGNMDVLGFCLTQLGVEKKVLLNKMGPKGLTDDEFLTNYDFIDDVIGLNDDPDLSPSERERRLIVLFSKHGHELEFTNEISN